MKWSEHKSPEKFAFCLPGSLSSWSIHSIAFLPEATLAMLPMSIPTGTLNSLTMNGTPVSFSTQTIKGVQYAFFSAASGLYQATYGTRLPRLHPSL